MSPTYLSRSPQNLRPPKAATHPIHWVGFYFSGQYAIYRAMVVRMRHTHGHTANRRSHHALKAKTLATCECGAPRVSHRACATCGRYRGRVVVDLAKKAQVRAAKKEKRAKAQAA